MGQVKNYCIYHLSVRDSSHVFGYSSLKEIGGGCVVWWHKVYGVVVSEVEELVTGCFRGPSNLQDWRCVISTVDLVSVAAS